MFVIFDKSCVKDFEKYLKTFTFHFVKINWSRIFSEYALFLVSCMIVKIKINLSKEDVTMSVLYKKCRRLTQSYQQGGCHDMCAVSLHNLAHHA